MKVLQAVTIAVAVATLCLLQALQTEARDILRADTKCSCDPQGPAYQLLRGDNQVHNCEVGFYCDCAKEKRLQCFAPPFIKWKYDEDNQWCALNFDCAAFFKRATTTTEPPTTTTEPTTAEPTTTEPTTTEPPTTEPSTTEPTTTSTEPTTTEAPTTEPTTTEPTTTEPTTTEPPTTEPTTTTPEPTTEPATTATEAATTTVEPTTTELPSSTPRTACSCDPNGPDYQLIRGADEVEKCDDGYYCDCEYGEVDRCLDVLGYGWRFDEETQGCEFEFDCEAYLRPTTTAEPSTTTTEATTTESPTTEPSTTEPSTTEPSTTTTEAPTTTEPPTTEPSTTEPSTTTTEASTTSEPPTTEPPTTEPSTTEPPTTEPSTTEPSTTEPPTPEPTPSTPAPSPLPECTCDWWWGHLYQLIRGEDQASSCSHGYYCDCSENKRLRCANVLTLGWRFDEDEQKCRLFHSCRALSN